MLAAERYVLGELQAEERENFEEHYFTCPDCARDVEELDMICRGTRAIGNSLPEKAPSWMDRLALWWARPQIGAAAACAMLALVTVASYQSLQLQKAGTSSEGGEALTSVVLRPETRGEAAVVSLRGRRVLVEVDLPGAQGELQWTLSSSSGDAPVLTGQAAAPPPGDNLKLLLPARELERNGEFILEFAGQATGQTYRFRFATRKN